MTNETSPPPDPAPDSDPPRRGRPFLRDMSIQIIAGVLVAVIVGVGAGVYGCAIGWFGSDDDSSRTTTGTVPSTKQPGSAQSALPVRTSRLHIVSPTWDTPVRRCVEVTVIGSTPPGTIPVVGVWATNYKFKGTDREKGRAGTQGKAFYLARPLQPGPSPNSWIMPKPLLTVGQGGEKGGKDRSVYAIAVVPVPEKLAQEIAADPDEPPVYDRNHLEAAGIHLKDMHSVDVRRLPDTTPRC